ncbi:MAG: adenylyltransferase/cytidyltransferase family protein [Proteobacteria bacterium]|nr:adenylyltransferase/cytidyltransferase family protein [Pseudomonadota bacterium]
MDTKPKVITFMVGDLLHVGHLNLLERASKLGDLIVGIPTSWTIQEHIKGHPTVISAEDRLRIIQALKFVDFAFVYTDSDALNKSIRLLKPDIICRGDDNKNFVGKDVAEELGIEIVYFPYTKEISSTRIREGLS